jgi:hypothetical protein
MGRSPIVVLVFALACSGNSLKVGSDDSGDAGEGGATAGTSTGGATAGTGAGGSPTGGASRGGNSATGGSVARGGTGTGAMGAAGDMPTAGTTPTGGSAGAATGGSPAGGAAGTAPITSCTDEFPFAGEWRGNVLDFFFEPMEEVRLTVQAENGGAGGYVGELVWGSGDPPPPATDADAPYPPGADVDETGMGGRGGMVEPWPGYPYTVVRGAGCDATFRVSVASTQIYDDWCALQQPIDNGERGWACMVLRGGASFDGETCWVQDNGSVVAEYPMWRCNLCGMNGPSVCRCDASGCRYNPEPTHIFNLTLSGDGNVLSGPDARCGDCTVRLERVE